MKMTLTSDDVRALEEALSNLGDEAEYTVNSIVHEMGFETLNEEVLKRLPIGARPNPRHARNSKPFNKKVFNLGFEFYTKGGAANNKSSFGYLVFPDEGRGPRNPYAQNFTEWGTMAAKPRIISELLEQISKKVQEAI